MFDLSRLIDVAKGFIGPQFNIPEAPMNDLTSALASVGLDVSALQGLAPDQLGPFLAEHGIDINALAPEQLAELANSLGLNDSIADLVGQVFSGDLSKR